MLLLLPERSQVDTKLSPLNCKRFYRVKRGTHRQPFVDIASVIAARRRQTVCIARVIVVAGAQPGDTKRSPLNYKRFSSEARDAPTASY